MIVEVKTKPSTEDVADHAARMEKLRIFADQRNDRRKLLGAVAGVVMLPEVKAYILKRGFYAVEPSGDTFAITAPEGEREW